MGMAAAVIGAGALAAVGGIASGAMGASAAGSAASKQAAAANNAAAIQAQQQAQTRGDLLPFKNGGELATYQLQNLLGSNGLDAQHISLGQNGLTGLTFQPTQAQLEATPGYQFTRNQGLQATQNAAAARGLGVSGAALKGAADYATGLADNTLRTQAGIFQNNVSNVLNPLMSLAGLGENAAAQTGAQGTQAAANIGNNLTGAGNAQAAGIVGGNNALAGGLNSAASAPMNYLMMSKFLGSGSSSDYDPSAFGYNGNINSTGGQALTSMGLVNPLSRNY